jgi:hypothetical protein
MPMPAQRATAQTENLTATTKHHIMSAPLLHHSRIFQAGGLLLVLLFVAIYWLTLDTGLQP